MSRVAVLLWLASAGCTGLHIDAATSRQETVHLQIDDAIDGCAGTLTFGETTATFTLSADQTICNVHVDVRGAFIDAAEVKRSYRDEVDGYPDQAAVEVAAMHAEITDVRWVDGAGAPLDDPVVPRWSARVTVAGAPVVALAGTSAASLLAGASGLDLGALVAPFNDAVAQDGTLAMAGSVDVAFDMASLARVLLGHTGVAVELTLVVHLDLRIEKSVFDEL